MWIAASRLLLWLILAGLIADGARLSAAEFAPGSLVIERPWARASAGPATTGAAYLTITNRGASADRLMSADAGVARQAGLHTHLSEGGVMRMRPVAAIEIPPDGTVELAPGGLHIMLMGLEQALREGTSFPLTLHFESGVALTVQVEVLGVGAMAPSHARDRGRPAAPQ